MKKYKFGDCIPQSVKLYKKLKKQGKKPKFVEGWVEVDYSDLEPCEEFLTLYFPEVIKKLNKNKYHNDYIRVLPHTWIICDNEYIDPTRNQFDYMGGIVKYYEKMRYIPLNKFTPSDITDWFDERDYIIERALYIRFPHEDLTK